MKKAAQPAPRRIAVKISRPGIHAKSKTAKGKQSKNYVKPYKGQGR